MAVSQSMTLIDHLLKCAPQNFSSHSTSTKLDIGTGKDLLQGFWIVGILGNFQIKTRI
jgi:hypothetical protein